MQFPSGFRDNKNKYMVTHEHRSVLFLAASCYYVMLHAMLLQTSGNTLFSFSNFINTVNACLYPQHLYPCPSENSSDSTPSKCALGQG